MDLEGDNYGLFTEIFLEKRRIAMKTQNSW
jgi:hypothetical protein